jgi:transcriptional regulator with XRE-family HTH domain
MPRKNAASGPQSTASETMGQRLARLRKERGWTQVELAERTAIVQTVLSDYERGKLRLNADMIVRFAQALEVTTDELLQPRTAQKPLRRKPSLRVLRRREDRAPAPASAEHLAQDHRRLSKSVAS